MFYVLSQVWDWGIKPQTFGFHALMLYRWGLRMFSLSHAHDKMNNTFPYFFTKLKIYHLSYFYLQTLLYWHCWSYQYAGCVLYELPNRPHSLWSLCGSVVEHRSTVFEGLRFNFSWGIRMFCLSHTCDKIKNIFLYIFSELKIYHLSYFYLCPALFKPNIWFKIFQCHSYCAIDYKYSCGQTKINGRKW